MKKTLDFVSHVNFIKTFSQYKIKSSLISWLKDFINDRTQRVVISNIF